MIVNYKEQLQRAEVSKYAVIAPDFPNLGFARMLIRQAEALNAPLILSYHDSFMNACELRTIEIFFRVLRDECEASPVPLTIHLDHALEFDWIQRCINMGFNSVMIDASAEPYEVNIERTKRVVELARPFGVGVEAELGHVGVGEKYLTEDMHKANLTVPEEAVEFVRETNVDALAVSIGTVHGRYQGEPHLEFDLLKTLNEVVPVPIVLHGSSGTGAEKIMKAVSLGIRKINVFTDLFNAYRKATADVSSDSTSDLPAIVKVQETAVGNVLRDYLKMSGSIGTVNV